MNTDIYKQAADSMSAAGITSLGQSFSPRFEPQVNYEGVDRDYVTRTPQGFPSVGYTYRKNPYQVFEMGAGKAPWASNARDPRRLIELSMREIAQELAVGRFYTRRV